MCGIVSDILRCQKHFGGVMERHFRALLEDKVKPTETAAQLAVKIAERSKVAQK